MSVNEHFLEEYKMLKEELELLGKELDLNYSEEVFKRYKEVRDKLNKISKKAWGR